MVADGELIDSVEWAHRGANEAIGAAPLATPWSSHRDLLGYRVAPFYDARVLDNRIDLNQLHLCLGGRALPEKMTQAHTQKRESLSTLLRVAGSVMGVLPADRKCFPLFAQLAKKRGWRNADIAYALSLTGRRIRQMLTQLEPKLELAFATLSDARLRVVP